MSNGKLRSDTTGSKDVVKLNLPQDKKESVFGCAECLLEDVTWCLKNFRYLIVLSNGEMRATFKVLVVDNQIKKFLCVGEVAETKIVPPLLASVFFCALFLNQGHCQKPSCRGRINHRENLVVVQVDA
jgi:hypothetical protein